MPRRRRPAAVAIACAVLLAACADAPSPSPNATVGPPVSAGPASSTTPGDTGFPTGTGGPPPEPPRPASADLIEAAVADGRLDRPTALLYRVYAMVGDPRLPGEFSSGEAREDTVALLEAGSQIDSLPAPIADQIRPYLLRPTDPLSPFHAPPTTAAGAGTLARTVAYRMPAPGAVTAAATCDPNTGWASTAGSTFVRVWAPCGTPDELMIPQVLGIADQMFTAESNYLGGQRPVEDSGGPHQGGDTMIDLYITPDCVPRSAGNGVVGPSSGPSCLGGADGFTPGSSEFRSYGPASASSGFVMINRKLLGNLDRLRATIAHELFHVFEYSYNNTGFIGASGATWFIEASATWAEWQFAHSVPTSTAGLIFYQFQGTDLSLQNDSYANGYVSFGWPLFMEQQGGGKVRAAWEAVKAKVGGDAIMDAIDGVLGFTDNFRIFGMRGWNQEIDIGGPVTPWLPAPPVGSRIAPFGVKSPASIHLVGTDKGATPRSLPGDSASLWAHYQAFTVGTDVGQVKLDFSKVNPGSRLDVDALVKIKGKPKWERRELPDTKTTWCVDNPDDAVEQFVIVLSNHGHRLTDKIGGDWTVESPKEPCLSYHIHIKWNDFFNGIDDPMVFDGYADTINPDALGGQVMLTGSGTYSGSRKGYLSCNPGLEGVMPAAGGGTATFQAVIVGDTVTVNAFADIDSTFPGVSTWPVEGPRRGTYGPATNGQAPAPSPVATGGKDPGTFCPHGWSIEATWEIKIKPPP